MPIIDKIINNIYKNISILNDALKAKEFVIFNNPQTSLIAILTKTITNKKHRTPNIASMSIYLPP